MTPTSVRPLRRAFPLAAGFLGMLLLTGGCKSVTESWGDTVWTSDTITYDAYLAIDAQANPKPTADEVIAKLGEPLSVHDSNGAMRRVDYRAWSPDDELRRAQFHFDKNEKLVKKEMW